MTMLKHIRRLACLAAVAIAVLALAAPAQAQMTLTITDVNTGATTSPAPLSDTGTGFVGSSSIPTTLGNYTILPILASANYDGNTDHNINTGDANVLDTVLRVTQTGTMNGTSDSLIIQVTTFGSASWSIPAGSPLLLSSTLAVSQLDGSNGTSTGSFATFSSSLISGPTYVVTAPNAYSDVTTTNSGLVTNSSRAFYLNNTLTLNTTGLNQVVNLSASTDVINPVPEPSTGIMALSGGLLMLAFGSRQRRGVK